ncbi:hypothetical protein ACJQWK_08897 [Exserohilum turcicum]|uniref:AB hydrolase-1 domain-containing protein n=1 Tax=Exserohilum turcicum (strain 28A) TaxID=671987 RepID=R0KF27_EXST2|nr:uncharacterized protein SETTUDRAFT_162892 [Exserohilum turcica Et28A]EOA86697.1 hypothetical protein SETTUDRAFT_162892 [Exserohilum turcica Et28A]
MNSNSTSLHENEYEDTPKCRYRLDNQTSHTVTLPDGRKLGYAEYGSPTGHAILYQHGLPGSRIEAACYHDLAMELGARVIAIDRPGIGWSSPCASRTVLSWAQDVEYLTEHLNLDTYSVLGVSGGGPYALSCAARLPPEKLKAVSIICGLGPPDMSMWDAEWTHWLGFPYGWRYAPAWLLNWFFRRDAFGRMELSDEERFREVASPSNLAAIKNPMDKKIFGDEDFVRLELKATREANAQGFAGIALDGRTACSEWGFRIEDIRRDLPVQLWYGKNDTFVPPNIGLETAARLGGSQGRVVLRLEHASHCSISRNWEREQLEAILEEMRD